MFFPMYQYNFAGQFTLSLQKLRMP